MQVPLTSFAKIVEKPTPLAINHQAQFPAATISFNLAKGASLGDAVKAITAAEASIGLPVSTQTTFQGAAQAFQASLSNTLWLILAAVVTMYIVLGCSTRATSIRSRSCRRCPRPVSVRCSP